MITFAMVKPLGGLLHRLDIKELMDDIGSVDMSEEGATEKLGKMIIYKIIDNLEVCSDDLVKLVAAYKGVTFEEALKLDMIETVRELFSEEGFTDFFKSAVRRASRE